VQPLNYQVATGALSPGEVAYRPRAVFERNRNVRVLLAEIDRFDLERGEVVLGSVGGLPAPEPVPYDTLIVAGGSHYSYFGDDDWSAHPAEVESLESALTVRSPSCSSRRSTGVLSAFPRSLSAKAERSLRRLGVTPVLGSTVVDVDETGVTLQDADGATRRISARTVVWAAGVTASGLAGQLAEFTGAEEDRAGRVTVEADLTLPGHLEVFALGDMVRVRGRDGTAITFPGVAPVAIQQGRYAAKAVRARLKDRAAPPFGYHDKATWPASAAPPRSPTSKASRLSGFLAWTTWLLMHLFYLVGFQNRLLVLIRWSISFATRGRGVRLITSPTNADAAGRAAAHPEPLMPRGEVSQLR
jgi:NADH dehydrogenase FAD-containing subunit